ncbi:MAG: hypothetical protein JRJ03_18400, partial [Deltaproteobacteria bacterium]|nr:hypothetical protein [Deltaproteobacteria bacterium]
MTKEHEPVSVVEEAELECQVVRSVSDANSVKPRRAGAGAIKNPLNALSKPAYSKPGIARR